MKRIKIILLLSLVILLLPGSRVAMAQIDTWDGSTADRSWYEGHESAASFYINNAAALAGFRDLVNGLNGVTTKVTFKGKTLNLTKDIDLGSYPWIPIATGNGMFQGIFNGNWHIVRNLVVDASVGGFFGYIGMGGGTAGVGQVLNLGLINADITATGLAGGFAGQLSPGSICENCYVSGGTVKGGSGQHVGGFVGYANGKSVKNCYTSCAVMVSGNSTTGGFCGTANTASIDGCYATGVVTGTDGATGGFTGSNGNNCKNCYSTGFVSVTGKGAVGAFAGAGTAPVTCYYDSQAVTVTGSGTAKKRSELFAQVISDAFVTVEGMYPQLKVFKEGASATAACKLASEFSVFPLNFTGEETAAGVKTGFPLRQKIGTAAVAWTATPAEYTDGENFVHGDEDIAVELLAISGDYSKKFKFMNGVAPVDKIASWTELKEWAEKYGKSSKYPSMGTYTLTADIVIPTGGWSSVPNFSGKFDGAGYFIGGLETPFFAGLGINAEVRNLHLKNVNIVYPDNASCGALVTKIDQAGVKIIGCSSSGKVVRQAKATMAGGLIGEITGNTIVSNCYSTCRVEGVGADGVVGEGLLGGFVGKVANAGAKISNCYAAGDAVGAYNSGGFVGELTTGTIENCYATGRVGNQTQNFVGGFVGAMGSGTAATIKGCYAFGIVDKEDKAFGFLGRQNTVGTLTDCFFDATVSGKTDPKVAAKTTAELSAAAMVGLGSGVLPGTDFVVTTGGYPQLKVFKESSNGGQRNASLFSVQQLSIGENTGLNALTLPFALTTTIEGVSWSSDPDGYITDGTTYTPSRKTPVVLSMSLIADPDICKKHYVKNDGEIPTEISTVKDLKDFVSDVNIAGGVTGKTFYLRADLDLSGETDAWTSIGIAGKTFDAVFEGSHFKISGLNAPLFGVLGENAEIRNVRLENVDITCTDQTHVGALIGDINVAGVKISGCSSSGKIVQQVEASNHTAGGLVGLISASTVEISNCYSLCRVMSEDGKSGNTGGLVGEIAKVSIIQNCFAMGSVAGGYNTGGLVGQSRVGTITGCYATGPVTDAAQHAGGLVGANNGALVTNCYSTGTVKGESYNGGLFGKYDKAATNCFFDQQNSGQELGYSSNSSQTEGVTPVSVVGLCAAEMVGEGGLPANDFVAIAGFYPQLKVFAESNVEDDRLKSLFSVVPLMLNAADQSQSVTKEVVLMKQLDENHLLVWSADQPDYIKDNKYIPAGEESVRVSVVLQNAISKDFLLKNDVPVVLKNTISNLLELKTLRDSVNVGKQESPEYFLMADIDLGNQPFGDAIGKTADKPFGVVFNGNGHVIRGLNVAEGLFGYVKGVEGTPAEIKDLRLERVSVNGNVGNGIGALVKNVGDYTKITNCSASGTVTGQIASNTAAVGGLIGSLDGTDIEISSCYSSCRVTHAAGNGQCGGLIGRTAGTGFSILNSFSSGSVLVRGGAEAGGLIGVNVGTGDLNGCYASGAVMSLGTGNCGGLMGRNGGTLIAATCFYDVQGTSMLKGIAADNGVHQVVTKNTVGLCDPTMVGEDGLSATAFVAVAGFYPQLRAFADSVNDRVASAVAALPLLLAETDSTKSIILSFDLTEKIGETSIDWTTDKGQYIKGNDFVPVGRDTIVLTATVGTVSKSYRVVNNVIPVKDKITSKADLIAMASGWGGREFPVDASYQLTAHVDMTGVEWKAIGETKPFVGVFDGKGHTITGLSSSLFAAVGAANEVVEIRNLRLNASNVVSGTEGEIIGALAWRNLQNSTLNINNCSVEGKITAMGVTGGLIGELNGGTIRNCYTSCVVFSRGEVGGLVGVVTAGTINNCYAVGTVTGTSGKVGGLIGINAGNVDGCYVGGSVFADAGNSTAGALIGSSSAAADAVRNCYVDKQGTGSFQPIGTGVGTVIAKTTAEMCDAALVGETGLSAVAFKTSAGVLYPQLKTFSDSIADRNCSAISGLPLMLLSNNNSSAVSDTLVLPATIGENQKVKWTVLNGTFIGGKFIPSAREVVTLTATYEGCRKQFRLKSNGAMKEIATLADLETFRDSINAGGTKNWPREGKYILTADIDLSATKWTPIGFVNHTDSVFSGVFDGGGFAIIGLKVDGPKVGLFGYLGANTQSVEIRNLYLRNVNVDGSIAVPMGALAIQTRPRIISAKISNCYVSGQIVNRDTAHSSNAHVGGLVGYVAEHLEMTNCYSSCVIWNAGVSTGGLIGKTNTDKATVQNCYATGIINGGDATGGLIGVNSGTVKNCYAAGSVVGKGKTGALIGDCLVDPVKIVNNFFDIQGTGLHKAFGSMKTGTVASGKRTVEMCAANMVGASALPVDAFITNEGYYPQLAVFAGDEDQKTVMNSALSVLPLQLKGRVEKVSSVRSEFDLQTKMVAGSARENLIWTADKAEFIVDSKFKTALLDTVLVTVKPQTEGLDSKVFRLITVNALGVDYAQETLPDVDSTMKTTCQYKLKGTNTWVGIDNLLKNGKVSVTSLILADQDTTYLFQETGSVETSLFIPARPKISFLPLAETNINYGATLKLKATSTLEMVPVKFYSKSTDTLTISADSVVTKRPGSARIYALQPAGVRSFRSDTSAIQMLTINRLPLDIILEGLVTKKVFDKTDTLGQRIKEVVLKNKVGNDDLKLTVIPVYETIHAGVDKNIKIYYELTGKDTAKYVIPETQIVKGEIERAVPVISWKTDTTVDGKIMALVGRPIVLKAIAKGIGKELLTDSIQFVFNTETEPVEVGEYTVAARIDMLDYYGESVLPLVIYDKTLVQVAVVSDTVVYNGGSRNVKYATEPAGIECLLVFTQNGQRVIPENAGVYEVEAIASPVDFYEGSAIGTLVIEKADQILNFPALGVQKLQDKSKEVIAEASSGLPVTLVSADTTVVSVSGDVLNLHKIGVIEITALQEGNENWNSISKTQLIRIAYEGNDPNKIPEVKMVNVAIGDGRPVYLEAVDRSFVDDNTTTLVVFNRMGKEVYKSAKNSYHFDYDLSNLAVGTYYYVMTYSVSGKPQVKKSFVEVVK